MKTLKTRIFSYILGLFIMTAGIALSVKSDLGVSPVSSIPYTITCVTGMEMGNATILLHVALVILQILLLRRNFQWKNLLQIPVGILFGKFTTLCNYLVAFLPDTDHFLLRLLMTLLSTVLIALGINFYLPADIVPLAGEGATKAVADVSGIAFPKVKVAFDVSMVAISLIVCLVAIHNPGSVGIGTIIAAFLVGMILDRLKRIRFRRDVMGESTIKRNNR